MKPKVIHYLNFHIKFLERSYCFPSASSHQTLLSPYISWLRHHFARILIVLFFLTPQSIFFNIGNIYLHFLQDYQFVSSSFLLASQTFLLVIFLYPKIHPYSLNESLLVINFPFEKNLNMSLFCPILAR